MNIRGMIKFSLVDYPGKIACVLFTGGCNLHCAFCHNPHLVFDPESQPMIREAQILSFLKSRIGKLDGVVLSGGEPSLRVRIGEFAGKITEMGFSIKIDSNGSRPDVLKKLYADSCVHAFGIDYKAPASKYCEICSSDDKKLPDNVRKSIEFAVKQNIQLDVRTTVHSSLLSRDDLKQMRAELDSMGVREWTLQQFNPVDTIDEKLKDLPTYSESDLVAIARELGGMTKVRGITGIFLDI